MHQVFSLASNMLERSILRTTVNLDILQMYIGVTITEGSVWCREYFATVK